MAATSERQLFVEVREAEEARFAAHHDIGPEVWVAGLRCIAGQVLKADEAQGPPGLLACECQAGN